MNVKKITLTLSLAAILVSMASAHAAGDGINQLINVNNAKANQANDQAMQGADKQRQLIGEQKQLRARQNAFDNTTKQGILIGLKPADELQPGMTRLGGMLREIATLQKQSPRDPALRSKAAQARAQISDLLGTANRLKPGFQNAESKGVNKGGSATVDELRKKFDNMTKDLEAQDRMGNFEIQRLMSTYNQAETLASSVKKKADDTANSTIGKI
jgi:hypothetical protein